MKKKVAVLFGGNSTERKISIASGYAVLKSLIRSGINAHPFDTRDFPIMQLRKQNFNTAYIALHGKGGEDGSIQGILEYLNIPYTGSGIMTSSIAFDKKKTKLLWKSSGLPVLPDIYIKKADMLKNFNFLSTKNFCTLKYPLVVKPNNQGSSIGIKLVNSKDQLKNAIEITFNYSDTILVEKFIKGTEYTVSILDKKILPAIKIITKNHFYDYAAKYQLSSTKYVCPSGLNLEQEKELKKIAKKAWSILGCNGCARIDLILDNNNKFWLLEINTIPGMTNRSLLPISANAIGISFDELVLKILNTTITPTI
ncbi:D-alanine--D-alanine ligase [Buchnera aphidicola (Aphis craccivora)]|uniref:D-alanine--D-alanine ligase n=1 Tax=Buchnera aphidicola (Aphis craccivora) TaxID=466616 RepID=A0A4D6XLF1_9GAMM|nr:D-alanine--D-alanine ligase [Buchnera aphidicola]QCI16469.1 D-alanine--D-alanine ligase [Buchnera aphidicola (Aphis craccivora)]QLL40607.1 D-alanine--D-alanine ligase [Buchnera aphidicola (Aphis craccivore)]WAI17979.1 MAG: D-alanine--D-alanine ligase [Buchnera aphidicola (Aphis craccivora)]